MCCNLKAVWSCYPQEGESVDQTITSYLDQAATGGEAEMAELWHQVVDDIHEMAVSICHKEANHVTIQPTMLVNEVWLRLHGNQAGDLTWENRRHFFGSISRALSQVLAEYGRKRKRIKRGAGVKPIALQYAQNELGYNEHRVDDSIIELSEALNKLLGVNQRAEEVARMKYILGLSTNTIASIFGVSDRTIRNDWMFAQAWLRRELTQKFGMES